MFVQYSKTREMKTSTELSKMQIENVGKHSILSRIEVAWMRYFRFNICLNSAEKIILCIILVTVDYIGEFAI